MGWHSLVPALAVVPGILAANIEFVTEQLPRAALGRGYAPPPLEIRADGMCSGGGVGFSVVSGAVPPGLRLSRAGYFSGVPARAGIFPFTVRAVDGCAWTARLFSLVVSRPPTLEVTPAEIMLEWPAGSSRPLAAFRISSTWPGLAYQVRVYDGWLKAIPDRGVTATEPAATTPEDAIVLSVAGERIPGERETIVEIAAWQAEPVRLRVRLKAP
jgi:hypothetical protein